MIPQLIKVTASGVGVKVLEKILKTGTQFIIEFPKKLEDLRRALSHVNQLIQKMGVEVKLHLNQDATIYTVIGGAAIGAALGAGVALIFSFGFLAPILIGALVGATAELIEVEFVKTGISKNGNPCALVSLK